MEDGSSCQRIKGVIGTTSSCHRKKNGIAQSAVDLRIASREDVDGD